MKKSQGLIFICEDRVMILRRKQPYAIYDNYFKINVRRCNQLERKDIYDYLTGRSFAFEDMYDFPKGRGSGITDAMREFREETGFDPYSVSDGEVCEDVASFKYVGYDSKQYVTVLHSFISKDVPKKVGRGENDIYIPVWINVKELLTIFDRLTVSDERGKYRRYATIMREIWNEKILKKK